jgi:hypothetical protein
MILNIEVTKAEDSIFPNETIRRDPTESFLLSPRNLISSLMGHENFALAELETSKVIASFHSHCVFSVEIKDIMNEGPIPAFTSTRNFIIGSLLLSLTVI